MPIGPCPPVQERPGRPGVDLVPHHGQKAVVHLAVDVARIAAPPRRELSPGQKQLAGILHVNTSTFLAGSVKARLIGNTLIAKDFSRVNTYNLLFFFCA